MNISFSFIADSQTFGKSKFYDSSENIIGSSMRDIFFELECSIENKEICRDIFCIDPEKEYGKLITICECNFLIIFYQGKT